MTRFIAVEGEYSSWIYDDQTGLPANLTFYGVDHFKHAQTRARKANEEEEREVESMKEWFEL